MDMNNNRPLGWTTLEESKHLVEVGLPVETADMCYPHFIRGGADSYDANPVPCSSLDYPYEMPCWSLGALMQLLPLNMQTNKLYSGYTVVIYCIDQSLHSMIFAEKRETLIEACVEMIILLLNNKML